MARRELRDDQWHHIKDLLPGKARDPGRTSKDNRLFVDAGSGLHGPGHTGESSLTASVHGTVGSSGTIGGRRRESGSACSVSCRRSRCRVRTNRLHHHPRPPIRRRHKRGLKRRKLLSIARIMRIYTKRGHLTRISSPHLSSSMPLATISVQPTSSARSISPLLWLN